VGCPTLSRWALLAAAVVLGWLHYREALSAWAGHIRDYTGDITHIWAVPLVSVFAALLRRGEFRNAAGLPSRRGAGWVCLFVLAGWLCARGGCWRVSLVSMIGLVWAVPYALWGEGAGRLMLFPAWFLLFAVPIPPPVLDALTLCLRTLASAAAAGILDGFGVPVLREETVLSSGYPGNGFCLNVADQCSGIRSLLVILAITAAYAQLALESRPRRWVLLACSIPVAIIGNILRILAACLVARRFGQEFAGGLYHDCAGYGVYSACLFAMFRIAQAIGNLDPAFLRRLAAWWRAERSRFSARYSRGPGN